LWQLYLRLGWSNKMRIFISYSTEDLNLVFEIENYLRKHAEVFYWKKDKILGEEAWNTIFNWIDQADLVLAVITGNTVYRAMAVGQEIGRAKAKHKTIIPIVGSEVPREELGFLSGTTYEPIDRNNPGPAIQAVEKGIIQIKQESEQRNKALLFIVGIVAFVWLASKE